MDINHTEYLNYMNNIGSNEDVSKYFVKYINNNNQPQLEQYDIESNDIPEFNQSQLIGINSPIINTKKLNIKPPTQEETPIQQQTYTKVGKDKNSIGKYIVNYLKKKLKLKIFTFAVLMNFFAASAPPLISKVKMEPPPFGKYFL